MRSHLAGTLRAEHAGQTVTLAGWVARRRDHGGVIFIDLRDASGTARWCSARGRWPDSGRTGCGRSSACRSPARSSTRPEGNENPELPTGAIEVTATALTVLSESAPLPFPVDEHAEVGEEVRLKYRYLDLRRSGPGRRDAAAQRGEPDRPRGAARARVRRGRDAHPHPVDARGRARLPRARPPAARLLVRAAAEPAAVQAAAHGRRAWSATSRSPAATATRTSAPTANPSSPSSTSR